MLKMLLSMFKNKKKYYSQLNLEEKKNLVKWQYKNRCIFKFIGRYPDAALKRFQ